MTTSTHKRMLRLGPMLGLFGLLLVSLYLMSDATQNSARFGQLYSWLLLLNTLGLVVLAALIGSNLYWLVTQYRRGTAGSRLTLRLVVMFVVLAVAPVTVVYFFSLQFLQRGIDSWFDVEVEQAFEDALELSRSALDERIRGVLRDAETLSEELGDTAEGLLPLTLNDRRVELAATEIDVLGQNGRIIASSSADPSSILPNRPPEAVLMQLRQGNPYVGLDPVKDAGLHIRAVVPVESGGVAGRQETRVLQVLVPVAERLSVLADRVQSAYARYEELTYLRKPLKQSFTLTLSLVLLLSLLSAVWAAFFSARRLVAPIRDLAEGTRAVAEGHYDRRIEPAGRDELGFLVRSFNTMTHKLARARDAAERSQRAVEDQRAYLEAVLGRLSSGVLTLDGDHTLRTVNTAAGQILGLEVGSCVGERLIDVSRQYPYLHRFADAIAPHLNEQTGEWREEVVLFGVSGRQILMCRGTTLPRQGDRPGGHVVVFDDVTALIQAQRDAAWAEVARRLAHEIKNPLTPIQLSAERLRHKYLKHMGANEGKVLDRATYTIVQQVEAMKEMVNDFSQYARPPQVRMVPMDLNAFVREVLELYRGRDAPFAVEFESDDQHPQVEADAGRLRQLMHNLLKNAGEGTAERADARVRVRTRCLQEGDCRSVELRVEDNGGGFAPEVADQLFEPYVTTKPKGTGLGLAVVKKIVEEHGGMIRAENVADGGARIVIRLPVVQSEARDAAGEAAGP